MLTGAQACESMQSYRQLAGDDREGAEMAITVMNVYESMSDPNHADYDYGMRDALSEIPSPEPADRQGRALDAYLAGYAEGAANIEQYYDEQGE